MAECQYYVTCPDIPATTIEARLLDRWTEAAGDPRVVRPVRSQSHEALLSEIWLGALRFLEFYMGRGPPVVKMVVADCDFIPDPSAPTFVENLLKTFKAVFVPYFTRDVHGVVKHPFFSGLWFWAVRLEQKDLRRLPRPDWIRTIGRPLDVGCGAAYHLIQSGFCRPEEIVFIDGRKSTNSKRIGWVEYPGLGVHVFNHRNFHQPDYLLEPFGITIRQHVENITRYLELCERAVLPTESGSPAQESRAPGGAG